MASTDESFIAQLLNLSENDQNAYSEVFNDYFAAREGEDDSDPEESLAGSGESEDECSFSPITHTLDLLMADLPAPSPAVTTTPVPTDLPVSSIICKCKLNAGTLCRLQFDPALLVETRMAYQALTHDELDIVILSKIEAGIHLTEETQRPKQKVQTERKKTRNDYCHHGLKICRDLFMFIHGVAKGKLDSLISHYKSHGVEPRVHKSKKKLPPSALSFEDTKRVVSFITNYADTYAITLPGRTPHHWVTDVKLLPTNCTKKEVYTAYCLAVEASNNRKVAERTFRRLWQQLTPFISTMKPATDLCFICQQGAKKVAHSSNQPDAEKSTALREMEEHLNTVTKERSYYKTVCDDIKRILPPDAQLGPHDACSFAGTVHYSFDFAQQMMYPSDPLQPGPIYFKTPRKCGLFGINCEALTRQVNYLIDEVCSTGKGANCVISLLHSFFECYGLGEEDVHLHADNCSGQNKNSAMLWYLMWRVIRGLHRSVTLSFLITGHTKFSPDCGFGLIKRVYKRTAVNTLTDLADVVNKSSVMNQAKLCGTERGEIHVKTYDWTTYLGKYFKKFKGIKKFHHFKVQQGGIAAKHSLIPLKSTSTC